MDFLTRQKKLQAEAKMALAMAKPMAKMQVEVEKQNRKKSPVADLVSAGRCNGPSSLCPGWYGSRRGEGEARSSVLCYDLPAEAEGLHRALADALVVSV